MYQSLLSSPCNPRPLLVILLLLHWLVAAVAVFDYPTDVNAPLGTNVTLECVADQPEIRWQVNNFQLLDSFLERGLILEVGPIEREGPNNRTTITFPASEDVNTTITSIICQAGPNEFIVDESPSVTISVYGHPLAPVELEVGGDTAHQLTLSWGPPFTLPGETLSYSLLIEDLDTGHTETVNTFSDTVYKHNVSEAEALACHSFLFSVSSVNDVGSSLNSSSVQAVHPSAPGELGAVEARVVLDGQAQTGSQATVQLTLQTPRSCFNLTYNVTLYDEVAGTGMEVSALASSEGGRETIEVAGVRENTRYSATLSAYNHFQFSMDNPVQADPVSFVTSGIQSVSVLHYENGALRITCTFAEGTLSEGCRVTITLESGSSLIIPISRSGGALEVVRYDSTTGVPSMVTAEDVGVSNPLIISGNVSTGQVSVPPDLNSLEPLPSSTAATPTATPTTATTIPELPSSTPTVGTEEPSSGLNILTVAIPAGVVVAVLMVLVLLACCLVCCRLRGSKYPMNRRDTLPYDLPLPHSPTTLTSNHDYKQVPPHVTGTIKEMSFNPLYGDHTAPAKTFDPPLPSLPQPSNGRPFSPHDAITLPSNPPPVYEVVSAAKQAAKLAANPQYGGVGGGANGATPNPQYGSPHRTDKPAAEEHMYASLHEPGALSGRQKLPSQYAQPYEHVKSSHRAAAPESVVILTDDNVSYNVSLASSSASPQKSL